MDTTDARSRGTFADMVVRVLDRRVGALSGDAGRAIATTHTFLLFALIVSLSYTAFYMTYDIIGLGALIILHLVWVALYVGGLVLARLGRVLAAALIAFGIPTLQLVTSTAFLGWEAGTHLFLLTGGQLVYIMLTERQRVWRWVWVVITLAAFLVCQFLLPATGLFYAMPTVLLHTLFSINAVLTAFILFMGAALAHYRVEQARAMAADAAERAELLANTDELTGLATRRPVLDSLERLSRANGADFCLALADLDHFKVLNDEFGHGCGDRVLEEIGARLRTGLRLTDSVGRWGGEEFIFVLAEASLEAATGTMERIRQGIADTPVPCDGHTHRVTVSIGLTPGDHSGSARYAVRRADDALYDAKRKGRDQVAVREPSAGAEA
ncbi:GGDEF domain-containing protein [Demequina sp. NBRC 110055]|uniref:GGDEF domain-containing protein n=1 Tax=Demequina sp. NBRC 110055 TaxID=1570344 RepID=UPI00135654A6|nr:GGDEF domain-containing protein [Demequina sp. NBRC 110055]